jgi:hypothetical protein
MSRRLSFAFTWSINGSQTFYTIIRQSNFKKVNVILLRLNLSQGFRTTFWQMKSKMSHYYRCPYLLSQSHYYTCPYLLSQSHYYRCPYLLSQSHYYTCPYLLSQSHYYRCPYLRSQSHYYRCFLYWASGAECFIISGKKRLIDFYFKPYKN